MKTYTVSTKDMLSEHKRIIPELRRVGLTKEANDQSNELKEIKKKVLKRSISKQVGKGGPIPTSYKQAASPIDLLKTKGEPPTVKSNINS